MSATVGTTTTGKNMVVDGNPYDHVQVIFPAKNNAVRDITNDLQGAATAQLASNTDTPSSDWGNNTRVNLSGNERGQGNIPVARDSTADRLFMAVFNAMHPKDRHQSIQGFKDYKFNLRMWNDSQLDKNGNPAHITYAELCGFQTMPPENRSDGTANAQAETWQFYCTSLHRDLGGDPLLPN